MNERYYIISYCTFCGADLIEDLEDDIEWEEYEWKYENRGRVLINDVDGKSQCKAHAVSIPRYNGLNKYEWSKIGLWKWK